MPKDITLPLILTIEETATYLRLPKETIEQQAIEGKIPGKQIQNSWRFLRSAIDMWLQSGKTQIAYQNGTNGQAKSIAERLEIAESALETVREELKQKPKRRRVSKEELAAAVELMRSEYTDNKELTAFTALDGEDFYV